MIFFLFICKNTVSMNFYIVTVSVTLVIIYVTISVTLVTAFGYLSNNFCYH